ncbi:MAG: hypothetical protein IJT97_05765, partial [Bacteroidaceae bacterium]|nr:hypothetical protein [Bacteroidaceae bacterium]
MMKPDKGRAQVPVNNNDDPQQTSIGTHASQLTPRKGNITGRHTVAKESHVRSKLYPSCHTAESRPCTPMGDHHPLEEVGSVRNHVETHPLSTPIEEKKR